MAKKAQNASLLFPIQYIHSGMVNRFALDRQDGFTLAHFGLVNKLREVLDHFVCVLPAPTLASQKENLVQYSDKIGQPKKKIPTWNPPERKPDPVLGLPVVDFIHLCHWDDAHAEICFWNYSQAQVSDVVRTGSEQPIVPFGVALLRCEIDLQRAFLEELYESEKS